MCGEKCPMCQWRRSLKGSPPHVRGKDGPRVYYIPNSGITPAYAGKSESYGLPALPRWDHPRVCGEELPRLLSLALALGSPPRVRGKVQLQPGQPAALGITPAYAGKRHPLYAMSAAGRDHPRVCGEKPTQTAPTPVSPISSMARWVTRVPGPSSSTEMPAAGI